MGNLKLFAILLLLPVWGCQGNTKSKASNAQSVRTDTVLVKSEKIAIFIIPTNEEIERVRSRYDSEEDFYTIADDAAYYLSNAEDCLTNQRIDVLNVDSTCRILNFPNTMSVDLSDTTTIANPLFTIILYKKGSDPRIVSPVEINEYIQAYF